MSQQERDVFYYHSDHLGTTSYITDRDVNATQFVSNKPYGETLVDKHNTSCEIYVSYAWRNNYSIWKSFRRYFFPQGTPLYMRALPPDANIQIFNTYQVLKPIPAESGLITPAFGKIGLGKQY